MIIAICDSNYYRVEKLEKCINHWFEANRRSRLLQTYSGVYELSNYVAYYGEPDIVFCYENETSEVVIGNILLLRKVCPNAEIIITSENQDCAIYGYRINATWFLRFPYNPMDVREALELCVSNLSNKYRDRFCINISGEIITIDYKDIEYFESIKHYVSVITKDANYQFRENIGALSAYLPMNVFLRCHKCYIVNITHIDRINSTTVFLTSNKTIPLSRNYRNAVHCAYSLYMKTCNGVRRRSYEK